RDSFLMLEDLEQSGVYRARHHSILDLGCGTGFLGIVIGCRNPNVLRIDFADWLLTPVLYSMVNWEINAKKRAYVRVHSRLGLHSDWNEPNSTKPYYDLVVCNPPYLPILSNFEAMGQHSTVAGVDLLVNVVSHAPALGTRVIVQLSDLSLPE